MSGGPTARAFAPATVANVICGFDVLGLALDGPGDVVTARPRDSRGVDLTGISGDHGRLPVDAASNTASVAAAALLDAQAPERGVEIFLAKGLPLASGLGSSAASAVAAVKAVDAVLDLDLPAGELLTAALAGERVAAGAAHPDNAAACLHGGLILARAATPPEVLHLPVPEGLHVALIRPHLELSTATARARLAAALPLADAVAQWADLAGFVHALHEGDLDLLARCLNDRVAEPARAALVPGFEAVRRAALESGALGCSLSGAGPSIFSLCRNRPDAEDAATAMTVALDTTTGLAADRHVSPVGAPGVRLLENA